MFKIKELLQLTTNNLKCFIVNILKDPMGYLLFNKAPSLILTIILNFILGHYFQNILSEQTISITVKVLSFLLKILVRSIFNSKMKIIYKIVVYKLIKYILFTLRLNVNNKNGIYIRVYIQIENKSFKITILKLPP